MFNKKLYYHEGDKEEFSLNEKNMGLHNFVAWHPSIDKLARLSPDVLTVIELWDLRSRRLVREIKGLTGSLSRLFFLGSMLMVNCRSDENEEIFYIFDADSGKKINTFSSEGKSTAFTGFAEKGALGFGCGKVKICDLRTGQTDILQHLVESKVIGLSVSSDESRVVSCSENGQVQLWDATTHQRIQSYQPYPTRIISSVRFGKTPEDIIVQLRDGGIGFLNAATGEMKMEFAWPTAGEWAAIAENKIVACSKNAHRYFRYQVSNSYTRIPVEAFYDLPVCEP